MRVLDSCRLPPASEWYELARDKKYSCVNLQVKNLHIKSTNEHNLPLRIFAPRSGGPFPVLVGYHGGSFVMGGLNSHKCAPCQLPATAILCFGGFHAAVCFAVPCFAFLWVGPACLVYFVKSPPREC